jgi:hypothetical protein
LKKFKEKNNSKPLIVEAKQKGGWWMRERRWGGFKRRNSRF